MAPNTASLHVGNLDTEVTDKILYEHFEIIGPILSSRVRRDIITRRSLGYAFVNFLQPPDGKNLHFAATFAFLYGVVPKCSQSYLRIYNLWHSVGFATYNPVLLANLQ